jgi:hypothetical protein
MPHCESIAYEKGARKGRWHGTFDPLSMSYQQVTPAGPLVHCEVLSMLDTFFYRQLAAEQTAVIAADTRSLRGASAPLLAPMHSTAALQRQTKLDQVAQRSAAWMAEYMGKLFDTSVAARCAWAKQVARLARDTGKKGVLFFCVCPTFASDSACAELCAR